MMALGILGIVAFGFLGWYIAKQTGQEPVLGFIIGGLFNVVGIAVLLVLAWLKKR